jgi:hypothetical protein
MIEGSCLCGGVKFEIDEQDILVINNCHCSYCRKVTGAAYGTFVHIPGNHFRWLAGKELVSTYESSPGNHRAFCKICGSRAPQSADWEKHVGVPAGCLDGDPGVRPALNIFTASKAPWHPLDESIPSFPEYAPEEFWRRFIAEKHRGGA